MTEMLRAALGADEPRREITIDGVRLAYTDDGEGPAPALVCLHAIGHGGRDFARVRARWSARRRVVTIDWPGHGRSGADRVPPTAHRYERLLDALGMDRAVLLGNSIGGAAAFLHTVRAPERVAALVLENPGGLAAVDDVVARVGLAMMRRFFAAGARGAWWFPAAFGVYYRIVLPRPAATAQRARIVAAAYEVAPVLHQAWTGFASADADMRALAPRVQCPVLFAWAVRDRFVQLGRSRAAIDAIPHARIVTFRAGHAAHLEEPEAFEAELERFLDAVPAETARLAV